MTARALLALLFLAACSEPPAPPAFGDAVPLVSPGAHRSVGPRLNAAGDRTILSWMEGTSPGGTLYFSELGDDGWSTANEVVSDEQMFVNWADLPSVVPLGDDRWFAHWLSFSAEGPYSYDIRVALGSGDEPRWGAPLTPHDDGTATEHGFVSTMTIGDRVGLVWLDGRNTQPSHSASASDHAAHGNAAGGMTLRAATVGPDGALADEQEIDGLVCDCCQTDIAVSAGGPLAVYRDRSPEEIRDIYLSRHVGGRWQAGERFSSDDWTIAACPVNGPAIAASGEFVVVAWFTAANDHPRVQARISTDGGKRFGERIIVAGNEVLGHVDVVALSDQAVAISWLESGKRGTDNVQVRSLTAGGELGPRQTVGRTALSRVVPQMALVGDELLLAWSDDFDGDQRTSSVRVPVLPGRRD
ncbi:MAG: exo-alpha-sialidase [Pseudomonadota bacterium]